MINVQNPFVQRLFQQQQQPQVPQAAPNPFVTKGSLVMFRYAFWMHDPMPLVIITDYAPGRMIRGINLHYLTYYYISTLINQSATNMAFSYQNIKGDTYIKSAFRTYKWPGISQVKKFDSQFILRMMTVGRTFDPAQIRAIRQSVDQQIQQELIGQATDTAEQPYSM
jgi:hypothetical protein